MQISREQEDFYGEDIFGVTYRCVSTDRDLSNNAARRMWRELGFGTKFKLLWLHRLSVLVTLAILVNSPPIWFINGNWEFDFLSWLLLISAKEWQHAVENVTWDVAAYAKPSGASLPIWQKID